MKNLISHAGRLGITLFAAGLPLLATIGEPVPEPSSMLLVGGGIAALILIARKRRARK